MSGSLARVAVLALLLFQEVHPACYRKMTTSTPFERIKMASGEEGIKIADSSVPECRSHCDAYGQKCWGFSVKGISCVLLSPSAPNNICGQPSTVFRKLPCEAAKYVGVVSSYSPPSNSIWLWNNASAVENGDWQPEWPKSTEIQIQISENCYANLHHPDGTITKVPSSKGMRISIKGLVDITGICQ